jgi:hypothetical protein
VLPGEMEFYDVIAGDIRTGTFSSYTFNGDTLVIPLGTIASTGWYGGYVLVRGRLPETVPIGSTLTCKSWLVTTSSEANQENNYAELTDVVVGSIDPNDKSATPSGRGSENAIDPDQRLSYLIQFENKPEATAEAIYVRAVDTLDPDLDWSTLAIGEMSHPDACGWTFDPYKGVITWFCDSIMLSPNVNPPEGEGFFTYSISPKDNLAQGTVISNTAWIRFDYNAWLRAPEGGAVIRTISSAWCCTAFGMGNVDQSTDGLVTMGDLTVMIDHLFITLTPLACPEAGNVDLSTDELVTMSDLTVMIDNLFITLTPLPPCP